MISQIVTDPKQAFQKTQELWAYLSENEPGNQARPETMEQLVVLLTRETARRVVHFINFTRNAVTHVPDTLKRAQYALMQQLIQVTKALANLIRARPISSRLSQELASFQAKLSGLYDEVQNYATSRLVNMHFGSTDNGHSMALVPYHSPPPANDEHHHHHHRLFPTNHLPPSNEFHLNFQCSIHALFSAVSGTGGM